MTLFNCLSAQTCMWNKKEFTHCEPARQQKGFTGAAKIINVEVEYYWFTFSP